MSAAYDIPEAPAKPTRTYLRDLPLAARLVLAVFLISVGVGYLSALVQLHFQQAEAGQLLPGEPQVIDTYHGKRGMGQLERLITADESKPWGGSGTMRPAFTTRSTGWKRSIREAPGANPEEKEKNLRQQRDWEIDSVVAWIHGGAKKENYEKFPVPEADAGQIDEQQKQNAEWEVPQFFEKDNDKWYANISTIMEVRCVRCHGPGKGGAAGQIHLDKWENVRDFIPPEADAQGKGHSLAKLAQSTHVHLLGFSVLYGLTGLIFAFTSYPGILRVLIAPAPLIAQIVDISFWWLARMDAPHGPMFAKLIMISGGVVALTLLIQISLGLLNLFGMAGRALLVILAGAVVAGGLILAKPKLEEYLKLEEAGKVLTR
jgi:hypothetical protein